MSITQSPIPRPYNAAYRLFFFRYHVRFPRMFLYSQDYIRTHGYHISGNTRLDNERLGEWVDSMQPPAGLALLHADGAPFDIPKPQDVVDIYSDIQEHLHDWEREIMRGIHPDAAPPLEDFRKLEAIAIRLYEVAMVFNPTEQSGGNLLREKLLSMSRGRNPLGVRRQQQEKIHDEKEQLTPYVSIVDRMERELLDGYQYYS